MPISKIIEEAEKEFEEKYRGVMVNGELDALVAKDFKSFLRQAIQQAFEETIKCDIRMQPELQGDDGDYCAGQEAALKELSVRQAKFLEE